MMGIWRRFICPMSLGTCESGHMPTFGVMTIIVFVLTSIHSFLSKVNGSLAIMMMLSRLSALVMRYRPPSWYSSNDVPDEKNRDEASDVLEVMYRVATTESPSLTTKFRRLGPV
jgi:hypothetical protein